MAEADKKVVVQTLTDIPDPDDVERAPKPTDPDDPDERQTIGADLDGFLFPGHHRVSGGWDGPDD